MPARNEASHIARAVAAVAAQKPEAGAVELLVVDGSSTDGTAAVAEEAAHKGGLSRVKVLNNEQHVTPAALNVGLAHASGEIFVRVDARSIIPLGYLDAVAEVLREQPAVAAVGGAQIALPPTPTAIGRGIARALNNSYAMGLSRYRRAGTSGEADTVYLGAYRTEDLRAVGGWNEALATNQDFDLNRRLRQRGQIRFENTLVVHYIPRPTIRLLFQQYRRFGKWKVRYWRATGDPPRPRQILLILLGLLVPVITARTILRSRHPLRVVAGLGAAALAVDAAGASSASGTLAERVAATGAMAATSAGWMSGIITEAAAAVAHRVYGS